MKAAIKYIERIFRNLFDVKDKAYGGTKLLSEFHADFKSAFRFLCGCLVFCKIRVFGSVKFFNIVLYYWLYYSL
jgi:hypothetical protein